MTALVELVLPVGNLYFGGHPAITPLVRKTAERLNLMKNVKNYQSLWYKSFFPPDNAAFSHLRFIAAEKTKEQSEFKMRIAMLNAEPISAAFFVGGMKGVELEYEMVQNLVPKPLCFPIASTGGAALLLFQERAETSGLDYDDRQILFRDLNYLPLFRHLLTRAGFLRAT